MDQPSHGKLLIDFLQYPPQHRCEREKILNLVQQAMNFKSQPISSVIIDINHDHFSLVSLLLQ